MQIKLVFNTGNVEFITVNDGNPKEISKDFIEKIKLQKPLLIEDDEGNILFIKDIEKILYFLIIGKNVNIVENNDIYDKELEEIIKPIEKEKVRRRKREKVIIEEKKENYEDNPLEDKELYEEENNINESDQPIQRAIVLDATPIFVEKK